MSTSYKAHLAPNVVLDAVPLAVYLLHVVLEQRGGGVPGVLLALPRPCPRPRPGLVVQTPVQDGAPRHLL